MVERTLTALPGLFLQNQLGGPAASRAPFFSRLGGLIRGVTALSSKHEEEKLIQQELSSLKATVSAPTTTLKMMKECMVRLIYCEMLGYDASFGYIHAIKLAQQGNLLEKRVGYLAVSLFLHESHELLLLLVNTVVKDLQSTNLVEVCMALTVVSQIFPREMIPAVLPLIEDKLQHSKEIIRRKAVLALYKFYLIAPNQVQHIHTKFRKALCDRDVGVMAASLHIYLRMIKENSSGYKDLTESFVTILKQVVGGKLPVEFSYHSVPAPWLQIQLLRILGLLGKDDERTSELMYDVLDESLRRAELNHNVTYAILFECVHTIYSIYPKSELLEKAAKCIGKFVLSPKINLKYLGLKALTYVIQQDPSLALQHQITIIECLDHPDPIIKRETSFSLMNLTGTPLCHLSDIPPGGIKSKSVVVHWGPCHFLEKARIAQEGGAAALLIANNSVLIPSSRNKSTFQNVTILIAVIMQKDFEDMKETLGDDITVKMYSPSWPNFDYTLVVIFVIAVFTVALGGYWSGLIELENMKSVEDAEDRETRKKKEDYLTFSPLTVVVFVVICCVMIVLLYFFYRWLVYVMIAIFCIASSMSLYNCLAALIHRMPCGQCTILCCGRNIKVSLIFLSGLCISVAVVWAVFRNEDRWAWILQDILGIAFCLNLIKTMKLPNFMSCVILLGLLLIYDVFFVFITPFITKNGESIMVELAAGPFENAEKLPVVIRVPKLMGYSVMSVCSVPVSVLGFGDIIVPGLLIAYCRRFDVQTGSSIYYISSTIAYAVGMIITFVVLMVMKTGQPALLYLVPCTLITVSIVAWSRKEMKKFWKGSSYQVMDLDYSTNEESPVTTDEQIVQQ